MYKPTFPEVDEVVMVQVKSIAEMGAYVQLLEYNGIEGMILLSELTRRRIRSVSKLIKVGRVEPVMVLRVDKEKGYIDLSKRRVSPEDVAAAEEKYNKSKMVHSILRHVAETTPGNSLEELYEHMAWPLYAKYGHCFEAFKQMVSSPDAILDALQRPGGSPAVNSEVKEALVKDIRRRMTPQPLKIRADVELTCFAYDGVMHIKAAMRAALGKSHPQEGGIKIAVSLVASPLYVVTCSTLDKDAGIALVDEAVAAAAASLQAAGGKIVIKEAARAVSERDDRLLAEKMEKLNKAAEEEDSDSGSEDETMGDVDASKLGGALTM
jgi:translation initiation factor 2 subunit 1|tara:strand:- start:3075 stop:4043 length:969 start_codon:yes stop_codon:yes gene_type:complete